jgi:hypothetical protein
MYHDGYHIRGESPHIPVVKGKPDRSSPSGRVSLKLYIKYSTCILFVDLDTYTTSEGFLYGKRRPLCLAAQQSLTTRLSQRRYTGISRYFASSASIRLYGLQYSDIRTSAWRYPNTGLFTHRIWIYLYMRRILIS